MNFPLHVPIGWIFFPFWFKLGSDSQDLSELMLLVFLLIFHGLRVARSETASDGTTVVERLASRSWTVKQIHQQHQDDPDGKIQAAKKELGALEKQIKARTKELRALEQEIAAKKKEVKAEERVLSAEKEVVERKESKVTKQEMQMEPNSSSIPADDDDSAEETAEKKKETSILRDFVCHGCLGNDASKVVYIERMMIGYEWHLFPPSRIPPIAPWMPNVVQIY